MFSTNTHGAHERNESPRNQRPGDALGHIWTHFGFFWASRAGNEADNERYGIVVFFAGGHRACPEATSSSECPKMSGHAGPMESFGKENAQSFSLATTFRTVSDQALDHRVVHLRIETETTCKPIF